MALTDNLVGYWTLDEASGSRTDSSGNTNTLTETAASVNSAAGKISSGASFVRADSKWLQRSSSSSLQMGNIDFSIACWVKFTAISLKQTILGKGSASGWEYVLFLEMDGSSDNKIGIYMDRYTGGYAGAAVYWSALSSAGTWYFVVVVHDSVSDLLKISVNNGAFAAAAFAGGPDTTTSNFLIGGQPSSTELMGGVIDEVGVWKTALTASDVTTLYNGGAGLTYPFGAGAGQPTRKRFGGIPHARLSQQHAIW